MSKQAVKLSEYPLTPSNDKGEILYDSFFYTYANTNYGATYLRKNYQLSLGTLRNDIRYFIGLNNNGRKMLNFWWGDWNNSDRVLSYIYEWDAKDYLNPDYVKDKFGLEKDPPTPTNTFILKTAPLPGDEKIDVYENEYFEDQISRNERTRGVDPNINTTKLVDKDYVDERFKGFRKLYVNSTIEKVATQHKGIWDANFDSLHIRPYSCYYIFDEIIRAKEGNENPIINIVDEDFSLLKNIFGQKLTFFVCLKDLEDYYKSHPISFLLDSEACRIAWSYENEWIDLYSKQQKDANGYFTIRFEIEITKDDLTTAEIPYKYTGRAYSDTNENIFREDKNSRELIALTPSPISNPSSGETYNIDLTDVDVKKDFFIDLVNVTSSTIISFDVSIFGTQHQGKCYEWNMYIQTGNNVPTITFGGDNDEIFWSLEDSVAYQPILQPNKLYCINFSKILNENGNLFSTKLLGHIKHYISLVKPPVVDYAVAITSSNKTIKATVSTPQAGTTHNHNCKIKWGDGSPQEVFYNGMNIPTHTYASSGNYTITVSGRFDGLTGFA